MEIIKYRKDINSEWQTLMAIKGEPGTKGEDGYTPVKGVDYFDGKDGKDGVDGAPGKDGEPGPAGADGKDYVLTEADKTEIANLVLANFPNSEEVSY